jgi:hypothetical protein
MGRAGMAGEQAAIDRGLVGLSDEERGRLEGWLLGFDRSWDPDRLGLWIQKLPPRGDRLRRAALVEMVRIDMERRWERGQRSLLESYLELLPELGTPETVAVDLIRAEFEVREQFGEPASLSELAKRFPSRSVAIESWFSPVGLSGRSSHIVTNAAAAPTGQSAGAAIRVVPSADPRGRERYRIIRPLGGGGMGLVYLARDTHLDRMVALKIPRFSAERGSEVMERFYREARTAARIQHPNHHGPGAAHAERRTAGHARLHAARAGQGLDPGPLPRV